VHVVLDEEWAHHGFCVRDLDLLGRWPSPGAVSKENLYASVAGRRAYPRGSYPVTRAVNILGESALW